VIVVEDFTGGLLCALWFGQIKYRRPDPIDSIFYFDIDFSEA
jgi:hypothetical protein